MNNDRNNNYRRPDDQDSRGRSSYGNRRVNTPGRQTRTHDYDGVVRYREEDEEYSDDEYIDYDSREYRRRPANNRPVRENDRSYGRRDPHRDVRHKADESGRVESRKSRTGSAYNNRRSSEAGNAGSGNNKSRDAKRSNTSVRTNKSGRKKNPVGKFFKRLLIIVLLLAALVMGIEYVITKKAYSLMTYEEKTVDGKNALTDNGVTNILLIGNDSRLGGEDGRSDAMILVSVSKKTGRILMTSILRDVYVEIPGYGSNRLNAAYSFGGPALLMETIEKNFDISVSKYMLVNFEAFANVVDAVGGIDLELTGEEVIWVDAYLNEYNELMGREFGYDYLYDIEGGLIHLNGAQALAYSRNRYIGTDFGRTERQRKVMEQIIKKLPKAVLTNFNGLIEGLCPNLTTNMSFSEVYSLVLRAPFWLKYEREGAALPIEGSWWNENVDGMAVLGVDFDANKEYFENRLYVRDEETPNEDAGDDSGMALEGT